MNVNKLFAAAGVCFFACGLSFFNVDSAWADKGGYNNYLLGAGVVFGLATLFCAYKLYTSNSK